MILSMGGVARAQAPLPLSLEEVIASVERRYPLLDAARAERRVADAELLAARGTFDPVWRTRFGGTAYGYYPSLRLDSWVEQPTPLWGATVIGGYRLGLGKFASYDGKQETNGGGELRLGLQVPLLRNGPVDRRRANIERAALGQSVADLNLLEQRLVAVRAASQRYWEWVAAGRRLAIARRLLQVAIARDAAVATRVERGDIPQIERTENARAILQREAQVVAAERALEQARIELSIYL
ncbi:MAG TPA: TolC family protein, partial [Polyangia bacterium]|nr:TolC family protein [Polyangia bacterium]